MTIKEIAELTGLNKATVTRKIRELFPNLIKPGVKTELDQAQATAVMSGLKKTGFVQPIQNAAVVPQNAAVGDLREAIISMNNLTAALMANVQSQNSRIDMLEQKFKARVDALPAPQISPRDQINRIVRIEADRTGSTHRDIWHELYNDFDYRKKRHFYKTAKRKNLSVIDYIEKEGFIGELLATARELYQGRNE